MEEREVGGTGGKSVIQYRGNQISISEPQYADNRYVAYVRPGDLVGIDFDLKELKVDVVRGDVVIIFKNGSTVTLASMAALGFGEDAPYLKNKDGILLGLEEFLNKVEVLDYNQAVLILSNRDEVKLSDEKPDIIRTASPINDSLDAGTPISGVGESDMATKGIPTPLIDPTGFVLVDNPEAGHGQFVVVINTTNMPFIRDRDFEKPGIIDLTLRPNIVSTIMYGTEIKSSGEVSMNGNTYDSYVFNSGLGITDDKLFQLLPNEIDRGGATQNIFINSYTDRMKYVLDMRYNQGVFPNRIDIVIPKDIGAFFEIAGRGEGTLGVPVINDNGDYVYRVDRVEPSGRMSFEISFPQGTPITIFDLVYIVQFLNPDTGQYEEVEISLNLVITPITSERDLDQATNVLASNPNGVMANTGSGNDVIIGGGGNNTINSGGGNDYVFSGVAHDRVNLGEGDDHYWGTTGIDVVDGGGGYNRVYYDNHVVAIDDSSVNFKDEYYVTYSANNGQRASLGFLRADIVGMMPADDITTVDYIRYAAEATVDGSNFVGKHNGFDILNNIDEIYFSLGSDVVTLSSFSNRVMTLHGGLGNWEAGVFDTLAIHNSFGAVQSTKHYLFQALFPDIHNSFGAVQSTTRALDYSGAGAVIDLTVGYIAGVGGERGEPIGEVRLRDDETVKYKFDGFERFRGSIHNDVFYGTALKVGDQRDTVAYWIDLGEGTEDLVSYAKAQNMDYLEFNAAQGQVDKKNNSALEKIEWDYISGAEIFEGSRGNDTIYGAINMNYEYRSGGGSDKLDYVRSTGGVTYILAEDKIYKVSNTDMGVIGNARYDHVGDIGNFNVSLSLRADVIIGDENGSYSINAGGDFNNDTLTYEYLTSGITVEINNGVVTVLKAGGTDSAPRGYDIFTIVGSQGRTIFYGDRGESGRQNRFVGVSSDTTLTYERFVQNIGDTTGVSFTINGINNTVIKGLGGTDQFVNIFNLVGTDYDDRVSFTQAIGSIDEIRGYNVDLGLGNNTVDFSLLSRDILGNNIDNASIAVRFNSVTNQMDISFGYFDASGVWVSNSNDMVSFTNINSVVGTQGDDIFTVDDEIREYDFNGYAGNDIANYSGVGVRIVFDMQNTGSRNVHKGAIFSENETDGSLNIGGGVVDRLRSIYTIKGSDNAQNIFLGADVGSYMFIGGSAVDDTLDYSRLTTQIEVFFETGEVKKQLGGTDKFDGTVDYIRGSHNNDLFHTYINTGDTLDKKIDGGWLGANDTDIVDFSVMQEGITVRLENGVETLVRAGNINWTLVSIEGLILTAFDDSITLVGANRYNIDGGAGYDTVDYTSDVNLTNTQVTVGESISVSKNYGTSPSLDVLRNIEEIILGSGNDVVSITAGHGSNTIEVIDAGEGTDTLTLAQLSLDVEVEVADAGFKVSGLENNKEIDFRNFDIVTASAGSTIFNISNSITRRIELRGAGTIDSVAVINFAGVSAGITLTLNGTDWNNADSVSGGISIVEILFSNVNRYVMTGGNDIIYGSIFKHAKFDGGAGNDLLSYVNFASGAGGVRINIAEEKIYKSNGAFDGYENIETIRGSNNDDTVEITDESAGLNINIDLGQGSNTVYVNTPAPATYNMGTGAIVINGSALDITRITNANNLRLTARNDTVIYVTGGGSFNLIDAGENESLEDTDGDILDASGINVGFVFFAFSDGTTVGGAGKAYSGSIASGSDYGSLFLLAEGTEYVRFNTIKGSSSAENRFYSDINIDYNYVGGSGNNDMLSYETAQMGVVFDLGKNTVQKMGIKYDTYSNIEILIGTMYDDVFIFSDEFFNKSVAEINSIDIRAVGSTGSNRVRFDLATKGSVELVISDGANTYTVGGQTYSGNFNIIDEFEATQNVNRFNVGAVGRNITLIGSLVVGVSRDTLNYTAGDVTFNTQIRQVSRVQGGSQLQDTFDRFGELSYSGTGTVLFMGGGTAYKYTATNTTNATLSYAGLAGGSDGVGLVFDLGLGTVNGFGKEDKFSGMTTLEGTSGDDVFILGSTSVGYTITLDGSGGTNSVSLEAMYPNGGIIRTSTFAGAGGMYNLINIQIYKLSKSDDVLIVDTIDVSYNFDGNGGYDTVDYSALNNFNINIDFTTGAVQKTNTVTNENFFDTLLNFSGAKTGAGDDTFTVGNGQVGAAIDAGGGNNSIYFSAVTYTMVVNYGNVGATDFTVQFSGSGAPSGTSTYLSFGAVRLGTGVNNVLNYTYAVAHAGMVLDFSGGVADTLTSRSTLNMDSGTARTFYMVLNASNGAVSLTAGGAIFMNISNFLHIKATGNNVINVSTDGVRTYNFTGGSSTNDVVSYANSHASGFVAEVLDGSGKDIKVTREGNATGDMLIGIDRIVLKEGSTVILSEHVSGGRTVTIDLVSNGNVSFGNYTTAINGSLASTDGYFINGGMRYTLTRFNDVMNSIENENFNIDGGGNTGGVGDTMNYTTGFTRGVVISYAGVVANTFEVRKNGSANSDTLTNFQTINLNVGLAHTFVHQGDDITGNNVSINFGGASSATIRDSIDFSAISFNLNVEFGVNGSDVYMNVVTPSGSTFNMTNAEIFTGGRGNNVFSIGVLSGTFTLSNISFDGNVGNNELNMRNLSTDNLLVYDVMGGSVDMFGGTGTLSIGIRNITIFDGNYGATNAANGAYLLGINNANNIKESITLNLLRDTSGSLLVTGNDRVFYNGNVYTVAYHYSPNQLTYVIGGTSITSDQGDGFSDTLNGVAHLIGTGNADTFRVIQDIDVTKIAMVDPSGNQVGTGGERVMRVYAGASRANAVVDFSTFGTATTDIVFNIMGSGPSGAYSGTGTGTSAAYAGDGDNALVSIGGTNKFRFYAMDVLRLGARSEVIYTLGISSATYFTQVIGSSGVNDKITITQGTGFATSELVIDLIGNTFTGNANSLNYNVRFSGIETFTVKANGTVTPDTLVVINNTSVFVNIVLEGGAASSHTLDMSGYTVASDITINAITNNRINLTLGGGKSVEGIQNLVLGGQDDAVNVSVIPPVGSNLGTINGGGQVTYDELRMTMANWNSTALVLTGNMINWMNGSDMLLAFTGFERITTTHTTGNATIKIMSDYAMNIQKITGPGPTVTAARGVTLDMSDFNTSIQFTTTNISNTNSYDGIIQFNGTNQISLSNVQNIILGSGNDMVTIDRPNGTASTRYYGVVDGGGGINTLTLLGSGDVMTFEGDMGDGGTGTLQVKNFSVFLGGGHKTFNTPGSYSEYTIDGSTAVSTLPWITINYDLQLDSIIISTSGANPFVALGGNKTFNLTKVSYITLNNQENKAYVVNYRDFGTNSLTANYIYLREAGGTIGGNADNNTVDMSLISRNITLSLIYNPVNVVTGNDGKAYKLSIASSGYPYDFVGFSQVLLGSGNDTIRYSSLGVTADNAMPTDERQNFIIDGGGGNDTLIIGSGNAINWNSNGLSMRGVIFRGGGMIDLINNVQNLQASAAIELRVGDSIYDTNSSRTIRSMDSGGFIFADLSGEIDTINIYSMEANKVIYTGEGKDNIYLKGEARDYTLTYITGEEYITINGVEYYTGGKYIIVTDANGNNMYLLNADEDDIEFGGINSEWVSRSSFASEYEAAKNREPVEEDDLWEEVNPEDNSVIVDGNGESEIASGDGHVDLSAGLVVEEDTTEVDQEGEINLAGVEIENIEDIIESSFDKLVGGNDELLPEVIVQDKEDSLSFDNLSNDMLDNMGSEMLMDDLLSNVSMESAGRIKDIDVKEEAKEDKEELDNEYMSSFGEDIVESMSLNEISQQEVESNYKLDSEQSDDPLKLLSDRLNHGGGQS